MFSPLESLFWRWNPPGVFVLEVESPFRFTYFLFFILVCVSCPSSTCRVSLYKTDICPISLISELLGTIDKAEEYDSARCRVLSGKGHKGNFPKIF